MVSAFPASTSDCEEILSGDVSGRFVIRAIKVYESSTKKSVLYKYEGIYSDGRGSSQMSDSLIFSDRWKWLDIPQSLIMIGRGRRIETISRLRNTDNYLNWRWLVWTSAFLIRQCSIKPTNHNEKPPEQQIV